MTQVPSLWSFIASADVVVKLVLLILMAGSVFSWTVILNSYRRLKMAKEAADRFESYFWGGINLRDYYETLDVRASLVGLASVFHSGFREFLSKSVVVSQIEQRLQRVTRAMRTAQVRTTDQLVGRSDWLATIGSISPYVGLFGTVWGIMSAFRSLGQVAQASVAMVAPGIAEALIATAIGLFVAIPAVVAYNRISAKIAALETRYDNFQDELLNLLQQEGEIEGSST